jgi:LPS-assembly lipoprotein
MKGVRGEGRGGGESEEGALMPHIMAKGLMPGLVVAAFLVILAAPGCGFHFRGTRSVELQVAKVFVESQAADQISAEVKRQLDYSGVALASELGTADAIVRLGNERFDRRVLSVDPRTGKVREFELGYAVDLNVTHRDGRSLIGPDTITLLRDHVFDETAAISEFEEENLLREEMRKDAAEAILRRLQSVKLNR